MLSYDSEDSTSIAIRRSKKRSSSLDISAPVAPKRVIGSMMLSFLAYASVCGGPFGIEAAVQAAGAFPTLVAIIVLPIVWGLPQALMTAELSTMMDQNGGYVLWVNRGLGEFAGWINGFNNFGVFLTDLPLYPLLMESYIQAFVPGGLTPFQSWVVKMCALPVVAAVNIRGVRCISGASFLLVLLVVAPFLVEPFLVLPQIQSGYPVWLRSTPTIDWSLFVGAMLWNYQGWDGLGCFAGEVRSGSSVYPRGVAAALVMITATYLLPVAVGVCVVPDFAAWSSDADGGVGFLGAIAQRIQPWLGTWVVAAAVLANLSIMNSSLGAYSRAMQCMARSRQLPAFLGWGSGPSDAPVAAVLFQCCACALLTSFCAYDALVVIDTLFNNLTLILEFAAFLRLRYTQPHAVRPYVIPGGLPAAWLVAAMHALVLFGACALTAPSAWAVVGAANLAFVAAYPVWRRCLAAADAAHSGPLGAGCSSKRRRGGGGVVGGGVAGILARPLLLSPCGGRRSAGVRYSTNPSSAAEDNGDADDCCDDDSSGVRLLETAAAPAAAAAGATAGSGGGRGGGVV